MYFSLWDAPPIAAVSQGQVEVSHILHTSAEIAAFRAFPKNLSSPFLYFFFDAFTPKSKNLTK